MAINQTDTASGWDTVLTQATTTVPDAVASYGVAVESALEDLQTAARRGRPLGPALREARRVGCTPAQLFQALDDVRGSGAAAPPL